MPEHPYEDVLAYWPETKDARCHSCHTLLTAGEVTRAEMRGALEIVSGATPQHTLDVLYTCAACGVSSYQRFVR